MSLLKGLTFRVKLGKFCNGSNGFGLKWENSVMGQTDLGLNSFSASICMFRASIWTY